jgi:hypothetical protein
MDKQIERQIEEQRERVEDAMARGESRRAVEWRVEEYERMVKENEGILLSGASDPEARAEKKRRFRQMREQGEQYRTVLDEMLAQEVFTSRQAPLSHQEESQEYRHRTDSSEDDSYTRSLNKINEYIALTSHSISFLKRQRKLFAGTRKKMEKGLEYLGFSDRVVDKISSRHLSDYRLFLGLLAMLCLLFFYVWLK